MAGRRHHYLPRFLQRSFAHRQAGKEFYVYAHHYARDPYSTNVMKLGQERDFYGGPDDTELDDKITQGEKQLAITVHKLNAGEEIPTQDIASLITAISFRTKTMRKALTELIPPMLDAGKLYMLKSRQHQAELRMSLHDPKKCKDLIYEYIREQMGHHGREQQAKIYALVLPKWKTFVQENEDRLLAEARAWVVVALERLMEEAAKIGDDAFLKALAKGPNMPERAERLTTEMVFEVWDTIEGESFILGDCGAVGLFTDGRPRLALGSIDEDVEIEIIFLPISPSRCVVARKPSVTRSVTVSEINQLSAAASREFFISTQKDGPRMAELRMAIGTIDSVATLEETVRLMVRD